MFIIDPRDKTPIYEQMVRQLRQQIAMGVLSANEALPSVRQVSTQMGVNPNTVQKAYRLMEAEGLIYSMPGKGSFVTGNLADQRQKQLDRLLSGVRESIEAARDAGAAKEEIRRILDAAFEEG